MKLQKAEASICSLYYHPILVNRNVYFFQGMGKAAEVAGDGGPPARDGGAGDARALRRCRRAPGSSTQHTTAGRRVRTGRTSATASPLSGKLYRALIDSAQPRHSTANSSSGHTMHPECL